MILIIAWTPLYNLVVLRAMGIPPPIAEAARPTLKILAFMPFMSSSRVFYQGLLVRRHRPRALGLGSLGQYSTLAIVLFAGVGAGFLRSSIVAACATKQVSCPDFDDARRGMQTRRCSYEPRCTTLLTGVQPPSLRAVAEAWTREATRAQTGCN